MSEQPPHELPEKVISDTGIFVKYGTGPLPPTRENLLAIFTRIAENNDIHRQLENANALAEEILDRAGIPARLPGPEDLSTREPIVQDAVELLVAVAMIRDALDHNDPERGAIGGMRLGAAVVRISVRGAEPVAMIGRRVKEGGRRGHVATHGTASDKATRHARYVERWNALKAAEPSYGHQVLDRKVAGEFGVGPSTIQRARLAAQRRAKVE